MTPLWRCPSCTRQFTRPNQRHACGTGDRRHVLRNRSPELVALYLAIEAFARTLGPIEFVARERYVLLRSSRIFADLVVMATAIRLAIHLPRQAAHPLFSKIVADRRHVTHVAQLQQPTQFDELKPFLREAYLSSRH
jgi:hypothetical protein